MPDELNAVRGGVRVGIGLLVATLLGQNAGCTVVADLDRFMRATEDAGGDAGAPAQTDDAGSDGGTHADLDEAELRLGCPAATTLCVRLEEFTQYVGQAVSVDLVSEGGRLRARAYHSEVPVGDPIDFVLPMAIDENDLPLEGEPHRLHLEIWVDLDEDGEYDADADRSWKVDLDRSGNIVFEGGSAFTPLEPPPAPIGGDFVMHFEDMEFHMGQRLEVMVIEEQSGRTVGLHRTAAVPSADFDIMIPGIVDGPAVAYRIEFYADANDDKHYDDPPEDHTWIEFGESNAQGLELTFPHGVQFDGLGYQFDFRQ